MTEQSKTQPKAESNSEMPTVDLSDAPESVSEVDEEQNGASANLDEEQIKEEAEDEARRHIREAEGESDTECARNAYQTLRGKYNNINQQLNQVEQRVDSLQVGVDQSDDLIEHLESIQDEDEERTVLRNWGFGISSQVLPGEIPDLLEKVKERKENQQTQLENDQQTYQKLAHLQEVTKLAAQDVQQTMSRMEKLFQEDSEKDPLEDDQYQVVDGTNSQ